MRNATRFLVVVLAAAACGSEPPRAQGPIAPNDLGGAAVHANEGTAYSRCPEVASPASVPRDALRAFLDRGIQAFLAKVPVEPATDREGAVARFVGWRIVSMADDVRCGPLGIHEGDVVVSVNGSSLERPDDVQAIWDGLYDAAAITVSLIRGGRPADATVTVEDSPVSITNNGVRDATSP